MNSSYHCCASLLQCNSTTTTGNQYHFNIICYHSIFNIISRYINCWCCNFLITSEISAVERFCSAIKAKTAKAPTVDVTADDIEDAVVVSDDIEIDIDSVVVVEPTVEEVTEAPTNDSEESHNL